MKNLLIRWLDAWRRSRWERARIRHRIEDEDGQEHLERQRNGSRDILPGGGAGF